MDIQDNSKNKPLIVFENVTKSFYNFTTKQDVLKDLNFIIEKGEFISIIGPSGSGKSTTMNIIGFLDTPTTGKYLFNGVDVSTLNQDELSNVRGHNVGFVFQSYNLMPKRTLIDNVSMPLIYQPDISKKERIERATEMLAKVKLSGYENYLPTQLSGGMKQRVAIARALVTHPQIILADEATGNLDSKTTMEIMELLKSLNELTGITLIMITHEPDVAEQSTRTIRIKDGQIDYDGPSLKE